MNGGEDGDACIRYRYFRRKFINRPGHHATAFVYAVVENSKATDPASPCMCLEIADCYRKVSLAFDVEGNENRANSLYKLNTLIETLTEFRRAFLDECEIAREREEKHKTEPEPEKAST